MPSFCSWPDRQCPESAATCWSWRAMPRRQYVWHPSTPSTVRLWAPWAAPRPRCGAPSQKVWLAQRMHCCTGACAPPEGSADGSCAFTNAAGCHYMQLPPATFSPCLLPVDDPAPSHPRTPRPLGFLCSRSRVAASQPGGECWWRGVHAAGGAGVALHRECRAGCAAGRASYIAQCAAGVFHVGWCWGYTHTWESF